MQIGMKNKTRNTVVSNPYLVSAKAPNYLHMHIHTPLYCNPLGVQRTWFLLNLVLRQRKYWLFEVHGERESVSVAQDKRAYTEAYTLIY